MTTKDALKAREALTGLVEMTQEIAEHGMYELADRVTALIDTLAPAAGTTVEDVFAPLWARSNSNRRR